MKKTVSILAAILAFGTIWSQNVGVGTTSPGTKLDVNGAITLRESTCTVSGTSGTIPNGYSQVRLIGSPTGAFTLTAPTAPANAGEILTIYNNTTGGYAGTFSGVNIPNGIATEFIYTNSSWVPTAPPSSGSGNYIQNQNATIQPVSSYRISGAAYVGGADTVAGIANFTSGTVSSSTTTGTVVVTGGEGISGAINIGGAANIAGIASFTNGTVSSSTTTGSVVVTGGEGISGAINIGGAANIAGIASFTNGTVSSSTTTGSVVVTGGEGISGAINIGGAASVAGALSSGSSSQFQVNSSGNIIKINNVTTNFPSTQGAANTVLVNDGSGNYSWSTISSGIIGGSTYAATYSNYSISTTNTLTNIPGLSIALVAGAKYEIEAELGVNTTGTNWLNFAIGYSGTIGNDSLSVIVNGLVDEAANGHDLSLHLQNPNTAVNITGAKGYVGVASLDAGVSFKGIINTTGSSGTAGNLTIQIENLGSQTTTVDVGSYLKVTRIQ